ncbi:uncharacterized protein LOC126108938 isoform X7 [Schistocerca cancellata]|uniref:uncharacterized protein LOC126108938 isoform X7 n=1 Tax=Schistocerca cancellata TaxID=274614 RepID=UPI002119989F|nr:uncharacterized protein LOC126108938 isoform X7 [Schistocerca cancellata]
MLRVVPEAEDRGAASVALSPYPLLSGLLDNSLQRADVGFDILSSPRRDSEASELTENTDHGVVFQYRGTSSRALLSGLPEGSPERAELKSNSPSPPHRSPEVSEPTGSADVAWSDTMKSPEFYDCGDELVGDLMSKEPKCVTMQKEKPCDDDVQPGELHPPQTKQPEVIELPSEDDSGEEKTARPVTDLRAGAVDGGRQDDDVVVLSDKEGADHLDITCVVRTDERDREEVGDIVILEPTTNREVPASVCRESSSSPGSHEMKADAVNTSRAIFLIS